MNDDLNPDAADSPVRELHPLRDQWWCFLMLAVALIALGTIAIAYPLISSVAITVTLGFLLLAAGITQVVSSFWTGKWSGMLLHLLIGLLYAVVGFMIIETPVESTLLLTRVVAVLLIVSGVFRIGAALAERFADWGWVLLNGGVALLLGLLMYRQGPVFGMWVIGLFLGIELIFNGWAWLMLAFDLKRFGRRA